jgi:hypothetical protein
VQVELSFVEYVHDREAGGDESDDLAILPANVKLGLTDSVDVQFVFEPYVHQRVRAGGDVNEAEGFGATQVRLKMNVFGNDGADVALGVMPFVQFATTDDDLGATDHVEGGLIVPMAVSLPRDWSLGLMGELDFLRDDADEGYGYSFLHTATLGHPVAGGLSGYVEYVGFANHDLGAGYVALAGTGVTYGLGGDAQLDAAVYAGISDAAPDFSASVGFSFRL